MPSRTDTSPSPPPPAPVASTPGVRAVTLQKVFTTALSSTLKANSYANFSACFPTPAQHCAPALEGVWKQLNSKLEEGCVREFEAIVQERGVVEGLNQWDTRIEDARRRMNRGVNGEQFERPLHTLSADELYTAHLTPYLQEATQTLDTRLKSAQQKNRQMMDQITAQQAEMERLVSGLEGVVRDIEGGVNAMGAGMRKGVGGLRAEVWEMEQEMAATRG